MIICIFDLHNIIIFHLNDYSVAKRKEITIIIANVIIKNNHNNNIEMKQLE